MSHANCQCVHDNGARFEECQPKCVRRVDYTKQILSIQNMLENDKVQQHVKFLKNVQTLPKSHMHIVNVFMTTAHSLKNVSTEV
jgi:hypothetical protein